MFRFALIVFIISQLTSINTPVAQTEKPKEKVEPKVIDISYSKFNKERYFFCWIDYSVTLENTAPDVLVGFCVDSCKFYLQGSIDMNAMFFIHHYKEDNKKDPNYVTICFGGSRPNDINIHLPKDFTAKMRIDK